MQEAWDDIRIFLTVVAEGSLAGAARKLNVNHSTVYRRIQGLEKSLGVKLFDRHTDGYVLNAAGEKIRHKASLMGEAYDELVREIGGSDLRLQGEIRIATSDTFGTVVLPAIIAGFRDRYPEVNVDLVIGSQYLNLSRREADVAVRPTRRPPENLIGRRIGDISFALYGADEYLAQRPFHAGDDASDHHAIGLDVSMAQTELAQMLTHSIPTSSVVLRTNSILAMQRLCEAGVGLAPLPCFLGDAAPRLHRLTEPDRTVGPSLWLLTHKDLRKTARIKAWMEYASEKLREWRPLFEGERPGAPPGKVGSE